MAFLNFGFAQTFCEFSDMMIIFEECLQYNLEWCGCFREIEDTLRNQVFILASAAVPLFVFQTSITEISLRSMNNDTAKRISCICTGSPRLDCQ